MSERFRADLARLLPEEIGPGAPLALAVSGGPDSMAMLALAAAALPGGICAATVDHGLRPAARAEAALVARACARLGVPHATLTPDQPIAGGNRQARARELRYALLGRWAVGAGAPALATAHHRDDQAETFLMRAIRGAGPAGLAGVRARRELEVQLSAGRPTTALSTLALVRPLLGWRRDELGAVIDATGLEVAHDPSNDDGRFERTRVRRLLADTPWLDAAGLARAARHAGEANDALDAIHQWLWRTRKVAPAGIENPDGQRWLDIGDLPREVRRRLAREAVRSVRRSNGMMPDFDLAINIEPLLDALEAGRAATQAGVLVTPRGTVWRFAAAPPRGSI